MAARGGTFRPRWWPPPPAQDPALSVMSRDTTDDLAATGIATGAPTVGTPAITQVHVLTATGIATGAPTVGTPTITQVHVLTATGIDTGAPTVGTPALSEVNNLSATGIATGAPTVGTPSITQAHVLTATGITASPVVGTPTITQAHVLTATGITASPVVGTPALSEVHNLSATGITVSPVVSTANLALGGNWYAPSEELTDANNTFSQASGSENTTVAPDGATTADEIIENTAVTTAHYWQGEITPVAIGAGEWWTYSVYIKRGVGTRHARIRWGTNGSGFPHARADIDLGTGAASNVVRFDGTSNSTASTDVRGGVETAANGFYRAWIAAQFPSGMGSLYRMLNYLASAVGTVNYTGDGSSSIVVWGHQVNKGIGPSAYTKTPYGVTGIATGAPTVGTPSITQNHALTATGIATGAPTVGTPTLTETGAFPAESIATGAPTVGTPTLAQLHALIANGIIVSPVVGTPVLSSGAVAPIGGGGGWIGEPQRVWDTRWDGLRASREEARKAFDEVAATPVAKRKEAAQRASEAVAKIAKDVSREIFGQRPIIAEVGRALPDVDPLLEQLEQLQAELAGLIDQQERIRAKQAREMRERWLMIEAELRLEAAREEELMVVFALAL